MCPRAACTPRAECELCARAQAAREHTYSASAPSRRKTRACPRTRACSLYLCKANSAEPAQRREYLTPRTGLARPRATTTNATGLWEAKRAGRTAGSAARAQVAASVRTHGDRTHHPHPPARLPDPSAVPAARTPRARLAAGPRPGHPPRRQSPTETVLRLVIQLSFYRLGASSRSPPGEFPSYAFFLSFHKGLAKRRFPGRSFDCFLFVCLCARLHSPRARFVHATVPVSFYYYRFRDILRCSHRQPMRLR